MKLKLKHQDFCDGCEQLIDLNTLAGHKRCKLLKKNMLPDENLLIGTKHLGTLPRPQVCKDTNEAEIKR